ncbi:MAG: hypothetical protein ACMXYG_01150 [Candidatus Woesearchaeota archaeon]
MKKKNTSKKISVKRKINSKNISKKTSKKNSKTLSSKKTSKSLKGNSKKNLMTKKSNTKKRMSLDAILKNSKIQDKVVNADLAFYCCNGSVFYCLNDLYAGLIIMDDRAFNFHVNKEKNDFYNWILYVFKEEELAKSVKKIKSSDKLKKVIHDAIK